MPLGQDSRRATGMKKGKYAAPLTLWGKITAWVTLLIAAVAVLANIANVTELVQGLGKYIGQVFSSQHEISRQSGPSFNPPLIFSHVSALESVHGNGDFAIPIEVSPDSEAILEMPGRRDTAFTAWALANNAAAISPAYLTLSIVGNRDEEVQIRDLTVQKTCLPAYTGSYFSTYTQGGSDNTLIGINLDEPEPIAQVIEFHNGTPTATGERFFEKQTIKLAKGEGHTITMWIFTTQAKCDFTLQLLVATSSGVYELEVPDPEIGLYSITPSFDNHPKEHFRAFFQETAEHTWSIGSAEELRDENT